MKEFDGTTHKEIFKQCGVSKGYNVHHIVFSSDIHNGFVDKHFPINGRANLIPLPIATHRQLHELVERTPAFRTCIESRIWLANYAFNMELDLI